MIDLTEMSDSDESICVKSPGKRPPKPILAESVRLNPSIPQNQIPVTDTNQHDPFDWQCLLNLPSAYFETGISKVNPGLFIHDIGKVGFPLSKSDVNEIKEVTKNDVYSMRVDGKSAWEFGPEEFYIRNSEWTNVVSLAVSKAVESLKLGENSMEPQIVLRKLLIFEPGQFYSHTPASNPDIIGTLVVYLPSEHHGGQVICSYNDTKTELDTSGCSDFESSTLTCFGNRPMRFCEVTSGLQCILLYEFSYHGSVVAFSRPIEQPLTRRIQLHSCGGSQRDNVPTLAQQCFSAGLMLLELEQTAIKISVEAATKTDEEVKAQFLPSLEGLFPLLQQTVAWMDNSAFQTLFRTIIKRLLRVNLRKPGSSSNTSDKDWRMECSAVVSRIETITPGPLRRKFLGEEVFALFQELRQTGSAGPVSTTLRAPTAAASSPVSAPRSSPSSTATSKKTDTSSSPQGTSSKRSLPWFPRDDPYPKRSLSNAIREGTSRQALAVAEEQKASDLAKAWKAVHYKGYMTKAIEYRLKGLLSVAPPEMEL